MKIEKIISFHTMKTVVIYGDFFAICVFAIKVVFDDFDDGSAETRKVSTTVVGVDDVGK